MTAPLVAIATRDLDKYSETFVRRHVAHLFGGSTAVIAFAAPQAAMPAAIGGTGPFT